MSAANPLTEVEREIPLSEVPKTIRDLRESWASAYTRAEQLERELRECRNARDAARQTCDDLTAHSVSQGEYIQHLGQQMDGIHASWAAEVASDIARIVAAENALADERAMTDRMAAENARLMASLESMQKRLDALVDYIDPFETLTTDDHRELAQAAGVACINCDTNGFDVVQGQAGQCPDCHGIGWRLR